VVGHVLLSGRLQVAVELLSLIGGIVLGLGLMIFFSLSVSYKEPG
jgi:hypothetical protein